MTRPSRSSSPLRWLPILLLAGGSLALATWIADRTGMWDMRHGEASFLFVLGAPVLAVLLLYEQVGRWLGD